MYIGQSQFLTTPLPAKPLSFNLALDDRSYDDDFASGSKSGFDDNRKGASAMLEESDARLMEMLAAQAAHRDADNAEADEDDIASDKMMADQEKKDILQKTLNMAASNGDVERVKKLVNGKASEYIDINATDEEGAVPLIYASCFVSGHSTLTHVLPSYTATRKRR